MMLDAKGRKLKRAIGYLQAWTPVEEVIHTKELVDAIATDTVPLEEDDE